MVFLKYFKNKIDGKNIVSYIHNKPFDKENGLNKTVEQLEKEGILIENIPEPKQIEGKQAIMYWNPIKKEIFYEYEDIPKSKEETLQDRIEALEKSNAELMNLIMMQATPTK